MLSIKSNKFAFYADLLYLLLSLQMKTKTFDNWICTSNFWIL